MEIRNTFRIAVATVFLWSLTAAAVSAQADFGMLNPAAPPETAQFSFIIGKWDCKTKFLTPSGEYNEGRATWTGSYFLDGWAIQDVWVSETPNGQFYGVNFRSFNKTTGKWDNRWLPQGTLQWAYYESEMVDGNMVMTGGEGVDGRGPYIDRNTFYEIGAAGWRWRKDRSWDAGETWFEGIGFIEATRID